MLSENCQYEVNVNSVVLAALDSTVKPLMAENGC